MSDYAKRLEAAQTPHELVEADSVQGISIVEMYDIMARPAIVAVLDDGTLVQIWQDSERFPLPTEVSYLVHI